MHEKSALSSSSQRIIADDRADAGDYKGAGDRQRFDYAAARQTRTAECLSDVKKNKTDRS